MPAACPLIKKEVIMQVKVLNIQGKETGRTVDLPEEIFGIEPNDHAIYLAVKQYLAAQRQGTHKVKNRAEVQGASRKLHRQKGTGGCDDQLQPVPFANARRAEQVRPSAQGNHGHGNGPILP